jgi:hypothetical protein
MVRIVAACPALILSLFAGVVLAQDPAAQSAGPSVRP